MSGSYMMLEGQEIKRRRPVNDSVNLLGAGTFFLVFLSTSFWKCMTADALEEPRQVAALVIQGLREDIPTLAFKIPARTADKSL